MVTQDTSRLTFDNKKTKDFESVLYFFLLIYFRVLDVEGDKVKGNSAQQSFGG